MKSLTCYHFFSHHRRSRMMSSGYAVAVACLAASLATASAFSLNGRFQFSRKTRKKWYPLDDAILYLPCPSSSPSVCFVFMELACQDSINFAFFQSFLRWSGILSTDKFKIRNFISVTSSTNPHDIYTCAFWLRKE